jgi:hypothetical protein
VISIVSNDGFNSAKGWIAKNKSTAPSEIFPHALSTKRPTARFSPALSNRIVSLFPSTATVVDLDQGAAAAGR